MTLQLGKEIYDKNGIHAGRISRLIASQSDRQIQSVVVRTEANTEIVIPANQFTTDAESRLSINFSTAQITQRPELDIEKYYALHPVEWQEEWGAVQGEILSLYPPSDKDPVSRRRFIVGSFAIIAAIAASLAYPITRYLLYPLSKGMPRLWTRLKLQHGLTVDKPVFVPYKVHRVEGYLEESIRKGVWLIKPSAATAGQIASRKNTLRFPEVGWANTRNDMVAFAPKCPHLGCNVHWSADQKAFLCPCHGSRFALDGHVIGGPAPRGLDTLPVRVHDDQIEVMDMEFRAGIAVKKRSA